MNRYNTSYVGFPTAFRDLLFPWQSVIYHSFLLWICIKACWHLEHNNNCLPKQLVSFVAIQHTTAYFILLKCFLRKLINHKEISGQYIFFNELLILSNMKHNTCVYKYCEISSGCLRGEGWGGGGRALPILRNVHKTAGFYYIVRI